MKKKISVLLFIISIISLVGSIVLAVSIGSSFYCKEIIIPYFFWIILCSLPFSICSLIFGILLKRKKEGGNLNIIGASIEIVFALIMGLFPLSLEHLSHSKDSIVSCEEASHISIPHAYESTSVHLDGGIYNAIHFSDDNELKPFIETTCCDPWKNQLSYSALGFLPYHILSNTRNADVFCLYFQKEDSYNPEIINLDDNEYVYFAFWKQQSKMVIFDHLSQ